MKHATTRRDALKMTAAAGAGVMLGPGALAGESIQPAIEARPEIGPAVRRRRIPKTGELVPMIGLGTSRTFDVDPQTELDPLVPVMQAFLDAGGSVIDSSPMYRRAEAVTGALLERVNRDDIFFATKVWTDEGRDAGVAQMNASIDKMGANGVFDLIQVHNLVDWQTHLPTLREWKDQGKIRYIGITEMRDWETVERIIREEGIDFIQIPYSIAQREVEDRILPAAQDHGVAVLVMRPFVAGRLFRRTRGRELPEWAAEFDCGSWAQFFLKFILGHPAVTCPIPATSDLNHMVDNMKAGVGELPDEATRKKMIAEVEEG